MFRQVIRAVAPYHLKRSGDRAMVFFKFVEDKPEGGRQGYRGCRGQERSGGAAGAFAAA